MKRQTKPALLLICCLLITHLVFSQETDNSGMIEGDNGFFYRQAIECQAAETQSEAKQSIYIAPDGDDNHSGAEDAPLRTLSTALCQAQAGQKIILAPGVYSDSVLVSGLGDSTAKPVVIQGSEQGESIFDGQNTRTFAIALVSSENIEIKNLIFQNYTDEGVLIALSRKIQIHGNTFRQNGRQSIEPDNNGEGFGLNVLNSQDMVIENNRALDNGPDDSRTAQGILGMGINTYGLINAQIRDNYVSQTRGGGILVEDGMSVSISGNTIENNDLAGNDYWDAGIWVDGGYRLLIADNIIRDNNGPAIQISDTDLKYPYRSCRTRVENNAIRNNYWAFFLQTLGVCENIPARLVSFDNNQYENNQPQNITSLEQQASSSAHGGQLCYAWPCGDHTACTQDAFDQSLKLCAVDAVYAAQNQTLYLSDVAVNDSAHYAVDLVFDAEASVLRIGQLNTTTDRASQAAQFDPATLRLHIPQLFVYGVPSITQPFANVLLQYHTTQQDFQILSITNK